MLPDPSDPAYDPVGARAHAALVLQLVIEDLAVPEHVRDAADCKLAGLLGTSDRGAIAAMLRRLLTRVEAVPTGSGWLN